MPRANTSLKFITDPEQVASICIRLTAFCLFVTFPMTWALWFNEGRLLLPSPLFPAAAKIPDIFNLALTLGVMAASAVLFVAPRFRLLCLVFPVAFVLQVVQDELRWQPFMYMYVFTMLAFGLARGKYEDRHFDPLRYMVAGIYFWAGMFKINTIFVRNVFPWFVQDWITEPYITLMLGIITPFFEAAIGLFLLFPSTRRLGILMATVMLVVVLLSLGPFGHTWGIVVWPWNVMIDALAILLFWNYKDNLAVLSKAKQKFTAITIALFILLPVLGYWGLWGAYPSFKLYCGCVPEAEVQFSKKEKLSSFLPPEIEIHVDDKNRLAAGRVTSHAFNVAQTTAFPHTDFLRKASQGFCPHLKYPEEAKYILNTPKGTWKTGYTPKAAPLCPKD